jgi:hypothetical protein
MPSYNSDLFNIEPYYDDFDETKNYQKILFRPGYAVQARELTQIQSILQSQVERLGNHIFKDGSKVYGGESAYQTISFLTVTTDAELSSFVGYEISASDFIGKVVYAETINSVKYLFVQTVRDSLPTSGTVDSSISGVSATATIVSTGETKLFSVTEGIYYVDGYFVRTGAQYAPTIDSSENTGAGVFGFDIERNYVGSNDDTTLLDPSRGSYNYNAPGADRYQLNLNLNFHLSSDRDNFIPLATVTADGDITNQVIYSDYAELENTLARRTYDESGSYVVDPFDLEISNHSTDSTKLTLGVGTGKGYLFGYEFENQSTEFIDIDKARVTESRSLTTIQPYDLGSYLDLQFASPIPFQLVSLLTAGQGITEPVTVNILKNDSGFRPIGTAKLISVQTADLAAGFYRFYLMDVALNENETIDGTIGLSVSEEASGIIAQTGNAIFVTKNSTLLFPVEKGSATKTLTDLSFRSRVTFAFSTDNNGEATVSLSSATPVGIDPASYTFVGDISDGNSVLANDFRDTYYHVFRLEISNTEGTPDRTVVVSPTIQNFGDVLRVTADPNTSYVMIATLQFRHNSDYQSNIRRKNLKNEILTVDGTDVKEDETGRSYIELGRSDAIRIKTVTITSDDTRDGVTEGTSVITDFTFDNGQRDYAYEFARLYFTRTAESNYKNEEGTFIFSLQVDYDYFEHEGKYGFTTVDSYPVGSEYENSTDVFNYEDIPVYTSQITGKTVSLASCVDFRFVRDYDRNASTDDVPTTERVLSSSFVPVFQITSTRENDVLKVGHEYYLPRIDKIILKRDLNDDVTKFKVLSGKASLSPETPADEENSLTLYRLIIPAYTHNPNDIEVEGVSHRRYTMKEIGDVDKRLEKIEVLSSLTNIESKVDAISFTDNGIELEKKAVLVDDFKGHNVGDVANDDYKCAVDFQAKSLRPSFDVYDYTPTANNIGENLRLHDNGIITLDYSTSGVTLAEQLSASETIQVNPYQLTNWVGSVEVNDNIDTWFDDLSRPVVKTNVLGENDAWIATSYDDTKVGFGSQWNDWESIWSGIAADKTVSSGKLKNLLSIPRTNDRLNSIRSHFQQEITIERKIKSIEQRIDEISPKIESFPDHVVKTLKNKVVDLSVIPYMRTKDIPLTVHNLKPNTAMNVYVDNVNVTDNVSGTLTTDNSGKLSGLTLSIPSEQILSGNKVLRFIDTSNDIATATTIAEVGLHSQGIYETRSQGVSSVRPIIRRKQTVTSSSIPSDVNTRKKVLRTGTKYQWLDPLSQTFFVDESVNPKGVFLQDLCLYFAKKDSTLPVTVQIRPTRNGYPHPSAIVPFSEKVVYPDSITVDAESPSAKTTVTFDSPVFLEPGEYAICISSNSSDYEIYTATIGASELGADANRIQKAVYGGKLYRPQNTNVSEPDLTKDIMFHVNRCEFENSGASRSFTLTSTNTGTEHKANTVRLIGSFQTPSDTSKSLTYSVTNGSILENENINLNSTETIGDGDSTNIVVTFQSSATEVSPVFDTKACTFLEIENKINNNRSTFDELNPSGTNAGSEVRYITKRVSLLENQSADRIRVFVDALKFDPNTIEVYVKTKKSGDTRDFDNIEYRKLNLVSDEYSIDPNDVVTEEFRSGQITDFDMFAVKVCLFSADQNVVPVVKSLRIVALDS